jgi:6-pyruvoyltetrahydropterin/6-carboxytetrahydropterin synthase
MVRCKICKKKFKVITHKHLKGHGITSDDYLKRFNLTKVDLTSQKTRSKLRSSLKGINAGDANPAKRPEVKKAISETVKKRWREGAYINRINGMIGLFGEKHPNYKPEVHTVTWLAENKWNDFLSLFQSADKCLRCGSSSTKINVHHIDEKHENFLISNLEPLCVPCHTTFHYKRMKQPFISVVKEFTFASAHFLPNYNGKCFNLHGHEWVVQIEVRKRIDRETGMVIDFSILKDIVNRNVIDLLDHCLLNDVIEVPTAENLLVLIWEILMFDALLKGINSIKLWESKDSYAKLGVEGMLSIFTENIEEYLRKYKLENEENA